MILGIVIGIVIGGLVGVSLKAILSMGKDITICDEPESSLDQEDKFIIIEDIDKDNNTEKQKEC